MRRLIKRVDWYIVFTVGLLCGIGMLAQFSITEIAGPDDFRKHLVWVVAGMGGALLFALTPPEFWLRRSRTLYVLNSALLALVYFVGDSGGGAQRWIDLGPMRFQPSEFAKLLLVITLAATLAREEEPVSTPGKFLLSLLHMAIPAALVFKQPDLGTALVLVGIWLGMCFVARVPWRYLGIFAAASVFLFVGAWETGIIKDYQKRRVTAFLAPQADPRGEGYQVMQARLAIGSGKTAGKGFMKGRHKEGHFVPAQHTDFIYTVVAEEGGFVGSVVMLGAYSFLLYRIWRVLVDSSAGAYRLLTAGVLSLWCYHVLVNLAMVLGLFPVVGVPLPLISYGGSSTVAALSSVGLVLGIRAREERIVF